MIGSDEVGNGSYFGPVTVCAAYVDKSMISKLKALGVRDSKELTDPQIIQLSHVIKELIPYKLLIVEPKKYNEIQPNYNAVHMKVALHNQAIYLLLQELAPTKPEGILIDQFTPENNYRKYVRNEKIKSLKNCSSSLKESSIMLLLLPPLLLAALLFRRVRQRICRIGFLCALWCRQQIRPSSRPYFEKGGLDLLANYAKLHFANTQKAQKLL